MASVAFEKASRRYPGANRPALDRLDLAIGDGEFLVLVGPSGCGKSTSLRMLAGLETVDDGVIRIGARDVTGADPKDRDVAMVFQNFALYPHMTVAQNMGFALKVARMSKADIRYRAPFNVYVAGFMRLPGIKLFTLPILNQSVSLGDWIIPIPREVANTAPEVVVGIRPEHFEVDGLGVEIEVEVVEDLGSDAFIS